MQEVRIRYLRQFRKDALKLEKGKLKLLENRLALFAKNPGDPLLRNHGLQGKLNGRFSINITGDIRAIYRILKKNREELEVEFIRMGTHSQLY